MRLPRLWWWLTCLTCLTASLAAVASSWGLVGADRIYAQETAVLADQATLGGRDHCRVFVQSP